MDRVWCMVYGVGMDGTWRGERHTRDRPLDWYGCNVLYYVPYRRRAGFEAARPRVRLVLSGQAVGTWMTHCERGGLCG